MTIHLNAQPGEIAETVLLPGDPMRAKWVADTFLEGSVRHNDVRGMHGYTGTYEGKRVSVQGTGMGMPSISIYVHELINDYGVKNLIRVGSCGAFQPDLRLGDIVMAQATSTDSHMNRLRFGGRDFAPTADFGLLREAYEVARQKGINVRVGNVLSGDSFYGNDPAIRQTWIDHGVLAVEMEAAALYTLAARFGVRALAIMTVSDASAIGERMTSEQRETTLRHMIEIALAIA